MRLALKRSPLSPARADGGGEGRILFPAQGSFLRLVHLRKKQEVFYENYTESRP